MKILKTMKYFFKNFFKRKPKILKYGFELFEIKYNEVLGKYEIYIIATSSNTNDINKESKLPIEFDTEKEAIEHLDKMFNLKKIKEMK